MQHELLNRGVDAGQVADVETAERLDAFTADRLPEMAVRWLRFRRLGRCGVESEEVCSAHGLVDVDQHRGWYVSTGRQPFFEELVSQVVEVPHEFVARHLALVRLPPRVELVSVVGADVLDDQRHRATEYRDGTQVADVATDRWHIWIFLLHSFHGALNVAEQSFRS